MTEEIISVTEFKKLLEDIIKVDRTGDYDYALRGKGKEEQYYNADGDAPRKGQRWLTPRELCQKELLIIAKKQAEKQ